VSQQHPGDLIPAMLVDLEQDRCSAMMSGDRERLKQLLHPDLIHVHAKGQVDSFETYFASGGFKVEYTKVERFGDLQVRVIGDAAVMTGRQLLEAVRKTSGEQVRIDSQVIQVWVREGTRWLQIAFQTTPTEMSVAPAN
jgi:ketosteroid isomerase-like protein